MVQGYKVLVQGDDKLIVTGRANPGFAASRFSADGILDTTFAGDGYQNITFGSGDNPAAGYIYQNGLYLVGNLTGGMTLAVVKLQLTTPAGSHTTSIVGRVTANGQWWSATPNAGGTAFNNFALTAWSTANSWINVFTADVNGDGFDDLVGRNATTGAWQVSVNQSGTGTYVTNSSFGAWSAAVTWADVHVGDVNGDGKADIVGRVASSGDWWVAISNGTSFASALWLTWTPAAGWVDVFVTDMNGDGRSDVIGRNSANGQWNVGLSTGSSFSNSVWATWATFVNWVDVRVGDVNGDGKSDVAGRVQSNGQWWVATSTGTALNNANVWTTWAAAVAWTDVKLVDLTGDGKADLVGRAGNDFWVGVSDGSSAFTNQLWGSFDPGSYVDVLYGDFSGDGRVDVAGRKSGTWFVLQNTGAAFAAPANWGAWSNAVTWADVQTGVGMA
jgi:hypothetical protein